MDGLVDDLGTTARFSGKWPIGFRSASRNSCTEETDFPHEVAERAPAHIVGNPVERAYRCGDALAKRQQLMKAWERFCSDAELRTGRPLLGHA